MVPEMGTVHVQGHIAVCTDSHHLQYMSCTDLHHLQYISCTGGHHLHYMSCTDSHHLQPVHVHVTYSVPSHQSIPTIEVMLLLQKSYYTPS